MLIPTTQGYLQARSASRTLWVANHPTVPQIEHGVPPPVEARGGVRKYDHFYPFERMLVGDSFWVSATSSCTAGAVTKFAKRTGWRFVTRGQTQDGTVNRLATKSLRGTRVWRTA